MESERNIAEIAKEYAVKCHTETNHTYQDQPYTFHLEMVDDIGDTFIDLIPATHQNNVRGGIWTHDCCEDCRQTFNNVMKATNKQVAELAYAVTNEKGKNRAERANSKYYRGIRRTPFAKFIKLADRIANVKYSYEKRHAYKGESMFVKYRQENANFIWKLIKPEWYEVHQHVIHLLMGSKDYLRYRKSGDKYAPMIMYLENFFDNN